MRKLNAVIASTVLLLGPAPSRNADMVRWEQQARNVTIVRDDWGIAHITGRTDADAVFGMVYAQAEDDFNRIEVNFLNSLGRMAEAEGEAVLYRDLRQRLYVDHDSLKAMYARSPAWLKTLMDAWADGLNFYLAKNPNVKPRALTKFEPWMALSFTEGSIGGDIERVNVNALQAFYTGTGLRAGVESPEAPAALVDGNGDPALDDFALDGSNGIAVAPKISATGRAILLINPHTSHYFRSELQMTSGEGLNAYGAVTWGQFFIYQGFNENTGWMHTTSTADATDEFLQTVSENGGKFSYKYGSADRPFAEKKVTLRYKTASGQLATREITTYHTHTAPVVRAQDGKWVTYRIMQEPIKALTQSYMRTKTRNIADYKRWMEQQANTSNNTLYADRDGNIAHFYVNFVPRRDSSFNWRQPVDGSNPATEWKGLHTFDEVPNAVNPNSGWVYNANDWPWAAAGPDSPKRENFAPYVDAGNESARGRHAVMVLENQNDFTIEKVRAAAYDTYMPGFDRNIPALIRAYDATPAGDPLKARVAEQVELLRNWDLRWSITSVPTSLAIYYTTALQQAGRGGRAGGAPAGGGAGGGRRGGGAGEPSAAMQLQALATACEQLTAQFGKCNTPWGDINRFQRIRNEITPTFDDNEPSIPVGFPGAGMTGSLASFAARAYPNTKKWYGSSGNSFVAVVEFGKDSVRAIAVTAGGESGDPKSKHFNDQAERYATGNLRPVYFYPNQLRGHTERTYRPGE